MTPWHRVTDIIREAMSTPKLSIIIPVLNEEKYLPTLLTDLSLQTYTDFEVIIVDGESDDRTIEVAKHFEHRLSSLTIITSKVRNVCHQRNLGADKARAEVIIFMDADNRLPKYFLQGFKYRFDLTSPDIFTTWINSERETTDSIAISTVINLYFDIQKNTDNPPTIEAMLGFKKDVFRALKGFNPRVFTNEGNDLVKKAIKKGFRYELFRDPTYVFSLRRLRKQGTFKLLGSVAQLEISRLLGKKMSADKTKKLYPMLGGNFFEQEIDFKKHSKKLIEFARSLLFEPDSKRKQ